MAWISVFIFGLKPRNAAAKRWRRAAGERCASRTYRRDAVRDEARLPGVRGPPASSPTIMSVKKTPIEKTLDEHAERRQHPGSGAALGGRQAVHHLAAVFGDWKSPILVIPLSSRMKAFRTRRS